MRIVIAGADGYVGQGVAARLVSLGHDVIGVGARRPESWSGAVVFLEVDVTDDATLRHVFVGADAVAHCGNDVAETAVVVATAAEAEVGAVVVGAQPPAGATVAWLRTPPLLGRIVDDATLRLFTGPVVLDGAGVADRRLDVVHPDDVQRTFVRALTDFEPGTFDVVATGHTTVRAIARAVGRRVLGVPRRFHGGGVADLFAAPNHRHHPPPARWGAPSWTAQDCVVDFELACRGRIAFGDRLAAVPGRLPRVRWIAAFDAPSPDGVKPVPAGPPGANGEFDTPVDPRFPAFIATNLSEALPGPFSPSSASVSVRGTRAAAMVIAGRLRPGGLVEREMSVRTTGVFGHRLYAGITTGHFMALTVPLIKPNLILSGFFGRTAEGLDLFGPEQPPIEPRGFGKQLRAVGTFANNLLVLSAASSRDSRDYVADVARLEAQAASAEDMDDDRLRALILLARDHVVHGWVLASASILVCTAYGVLLRLLSGRDVMPAAGPQVASAQSLGAVHRLAALARRDPATAAALAAVNPTLDELAASAPEFVAELYRELAVIGHRGPGEVEMRAITYADDPALLMRIVAKAASRPEAAAGARGHGSTVPRWTLPVAAAAAGQLREREVRRDRMVRAIWVLRTLLRTYARRLIDADRITEVDDVFYLQVDELEAPPPDLRSVVDRRRAEQADLERLAPPEAFSGQWHPLPSPGSVLGSGDSLQGLGVCGGTVRGRVRVVRPDNINELLPGEVLVAKVTDVGYTPAFAYAAAVVTELGGPISHAAIVAREFGVPCVVNVPGAASRLPTGALIEVDGPTGRITVLGG